MDTKIYIAGIIVAAVITAGLMKISQAENPQGSTENCHVEGGGVLVCEKDGCRVGEGGALECGNEPKQGNCRVGEGGAVECGDKPKQGNCRIGEGGAYVCDDKPKQKIKGNI